MEGLGAEGFTNISIVTTQIHPSIEEARHSGEESGASVSARMNSAWHEEL
jgi:hypothetical protein